MKNYFYLVIQKKKTINIKIYYFYNIKIFKFYHLQNI